MKADIFFYLILFILIGEYVIGVAADVLNMRHIRPGLPMAFREYYDSKRYLDSQRYLKDTTRLGIWVDSVTTPAMILFFAFGGFNLIDRFVRGFQFGPILSGLMFIGILLSASAAAHLPFSVYRTFVIEEKYGFNTTTPKTFLLDVVKILVLTAVIGGPLLAVVLWFFQRTGPAAWLYCWMAVTGIQLFLLFVAPIWIMPLFNKYKPLEEKELKAEVEAYLRGQGFKAKGVFTMDGSRRSTKSNAFFTGFGKFRRVVLFDTLIRKHTVKEIISVLAHEIGHYKRRHITKSIFISVALTGLMFLLLSFFLQSRAIFEAFQMDQSSVYAGLVFFALMYAPVNLFFSIVQNWLSRKNEHEADAFAVRSMEDRESLIAALKKLSADNLSNLTPHPFKVILAYSHPPILERIHAIEALNIADETFS